MYKIIENVVGPVITNKIRLMVGNKKRSTAGALAIAMFDSYINLFRTGSDALKVYLVVAPIMNVFLFSGFFPFLFIVASDFYLFKLLTK